MDGYISGGGLLEQQLFLNAGLQFAENKLTA
jgi:hypothetical protein